MCSVAHWAGDMFSRQVLGAGLLQVGGVVASQILVSHIIFGGFGPGQAPKAVAHDYVPSAIKQVQASRGGVPPPPPGPP